MTEVVVGGRTGATTGGGGVFGGGVPEGLCPLGVTGRRIERGGGGWDGGGGLLDPVELLGDVFFNGNSLLELCLGAWWKFI